MPPDAVLALLCLIGLIPYAAIGGVVGALAMRLLDLDVKKSTAYGYVRGLAGDINHGNNDAWIGFFFMALVWPAVLTAIAACGVLFIPGWIAVKVATYLSKAQIKKADSR